jgi:hypothetical protein
MPAMEQVRPVGRIDYLSPRGKICESCYFYSDAEFVDQVLQDSNYGVPMVVNVFRDKDGSTISLGFTSRLNSLPAGFKIINYVEGEEMNEYQRLSQMAKRYKELYPSGTRILLEQMGDDPRPIPPGTKGTVDVVDDMGTIHCRFDNGRYLGLIPGEDSFRKLTREELMDERSEKLQTEYIDKINNDVIPYIGWSGMSLAYQRDSMAVPTDLLKMLHEKFVEVYGTDHVEPDNGMLTVPGVVQTHDGKLYTALLELDAASSGEHWGTTFFTPKGVLSDQSADPEIQTEVQKMVPYEYWYTVEMERDHHVDWSICPDEVNNMIQEAIGQGQTDGVTMR